MGNLINVSMNTNSVIIINIGGAFLDVTPEQLENLQARVGNSMDIEVMGVMDMDEMSENEWASPREWPMTDCDSKPSPAPAPKPKSQPNSQSDFPALRKAEEQRKRKQEFWANVKRKW